MTRYQALNAAYYKAANEYEEQRKVAYDVLLWFRQTLIQFLGCDMWKVRIVPFEFDEFDPPRDFNRQRLHPDKLAVCMKEQTHTCVLEVALDAYVHRQIVGTRKDKSTGNQLLIVGAAEPKCFVLDQEGLGITEAIDHVYQILNYVVTTHFDRFGEDDGYILPLLLKKR